MANPLRKNFFKYGNKLKKGKPWPELCPGDIVDIVAPSSDCDKKALLKVRNYVSEMGLVPRIRPGLFGKSLLCANSSKKRFDHFKKALFASDSKAVWTLRGGYGAAHLLPYLNKISPPKKTKLFIGYSDLTHLHSFLNYRWGWSTLHATMLEELATGAGTIQEQKDLDQIIFGQKTHILFKKLKPLNTPARRSKKIISTIGGGNLTILLAGMGTPWQVSGKGQIIVVEDIGERDYRVDRMLTQLNQAQFFKGVRALIFGDFVRSEELDSYSLAKDVQREFAKRAPFPVLSNFPCGHSIRQRPVPFLTRAELQLGTKPEIKIQTGVC